MDAPDTRRTVAGGFAVLAVIGAAFVMGRCSTESAAVEIATTDPVEIVYVSHDTDAATAAALTQLDAWVQSTSTTTTTAAPRRATAAVAPSTEIGDASIFTDAEAAFFACVRWRESRGDYTVVNSTGTFRGAYQWYQGGWDHYAAQVAPDYVGVPPNEAPPAIQDLVSVTAYRQVGARPWGGACS